MNKALKVLNEELAQVERHLNANRGQVEEYRLALKEAEETVAWFEQARKELKAAIELIAANEN